MAAPVKNEVTEELEGEEEEPRIIRLSTDEYFFPSRRESAATSATGASDNGIAMEDSEPSSPGSSTGEPPTIPFEALSSRYALEAESIYDEENGGRLVSFKDQSITKPKPRRPGQQDDHHMSTSDDEYEETLLYIDLDDIPNVDELFAVEPDDFLSFQTKRQRELPKPKKPTRPEIKLKMYNLDSNQPVLQIGNRYYVGKYEEPMGSSLFFQPKEPVGKPLPPNRLQSIVREPRPRRDKVFHEKLCSDKYDEYELVANVDKVLKMTRREARIAGRDLQKMPVTPGGLPPLMPQRTWPTGYTPSQVFSGKYHTEKKLPHGPFDSSFSELGQPSASASSAKTNESPSDQQASASVPASTRGQETAESSDQAELQKPPPHGLHHQNKTPF